MTAYSIPFIPSVKEILALLSLSARAGKMWYIRGYDKLKLSSAYVHIHFVPRFVIIVTFEGSYQESNGRCLHPNT